MSLISFQGHTGEKWVFFVCFFTIDYKGVDCIIKDRVFFLNICFISFLIEVTRNLKISNSGGKGYHHLHTTLLLELQLMSKGIVSYKCFF